MKFTIWIAFATVLLIANSLQTNTHLAANSSTCLSPGVWNATSSTCSCLGGSVLDKATGLCVCNSTLPWLNNGVCTACAFPDVYENTTNTCYLCPSGYAYNLTVHFCQSISCPPGLTYNSTIHTCTCPSSTPYIYNNTCNKCPLNNFLSNGSCQPCWKGSIFNATAKKCECNSSAGSFPKGVNINACVPCFFPNYFNLK